MLCRTNRWDMGFLDLLKITVHQSRNGVKQLQKESLRKTFAKQNVKGIYLRCGRLRYRLGAMRRSPATLCQVSPRSHRAPWPFNTHPAESGAGQDRGTVGSDESPDCQTSPWWWGRSSESSQGQPQARDGQARPGQDRQWPSCEVTGMGAPVGTSTRPSA